MGGSGTFAGHAIPASFFLMFGTFFLALTLKRCRELNSSPPRDNDNPSSISANISYCDAHVPERNLSLLRRTGIILTFCTTIGMLFEGGGALKDGIGFFHQLAHQALYLCFFFVGCVAYLESLRLVPPDSSRSALSLAFLLQYVLWNEHGLMKNDPGDARVHLLQAQVNLGAAVAFGASVCFPTSMLAYVSGWALMVLNALWMFTAGLNACCVDIMRHTVGAALVLEALLIAAVITLAAACFSGPRAGHQEVNGAIGSSYISISVAEETAKLNVAPEGR